MLVDVGGSFVSILVSVAGNVSRKLLKLPRKDPVGVVGEEERLDRGVLAVELNPASLAFDEGGLGVFDWGDNNSFTSRKAQLAGHEAFARWLKTLLHLSWR